MFTIGGSRAISHRNDREQQAQQVAAIPRRRKFSTETPLENAEIHRRADRRRQPRS